jgi:hypothetical protein
MNPHEMHEDG